MQIKTFEDRESWLKFREGKITGTRLKDIIVKRGTTPKKGFYELIAERVAIKEEYENPMERGIRLESEAIERFEKETGKKVNSDLVVWISDENSDMAISPDGTIGKTEAIEVKCLNSASHIEAYLTKTIPADHEFQVLQYFIINEKLKTLYFAFYDTRMPIKDFFFIKVERKDLEEDIKKYKDEEIRVLGEVDKIVKSLTKF
jgi:putative phage-type endonuclease